MADSLEQRARPSDPWAALGRNWRGNLASELERNIVLVDKNARLIVVTHHVPHPACLPEGDPRCGEHSVRIAEVIARHADRIELVVHGHKHRRYGPKTIDGVRYIAHPFGYPRQPEGPEDGLRVVELGG